MEELEELEEYKNIKIALLGATTVGKTSLSRMLTNEDIDSDDYIPTIGVDIKINYNHDQKIKIIIFDLAGLERFQSIIDSYVKTCDCILFCFTSNNISSFIDMKKLYKYYKDKDYLVNKQLLVVATKVDLTEDNQYETYAKEYAEKIGTTFFRTSVKKRLGKKFILNYFTQGIEEPLLSLQISDYDKTIKTKRILYCCCPIS